MTRSAGVIFEDRVPRTFEKWRQVPPTLRSAIRKLHEQYSHALYGDDLVRHIRLGGGAPRAVAAAKLFRCERCAEAVRPPARPIAGIPRYTRHSECIGIDVMFIPDMTDTFHAYLLIVDLATDYTVVQWMVEGVGNRAPKPTAEQARRAMQEGWVRVLLTPQRIQIDQDSAFRGAFEEMCDSLGVPLIPVPADAHFSHGKVERRVGFVKVMAEKVFKDMNVIGAEAGRVAGSRICETCCRLCN